jgi:hypothetical protein
MKYTPRQEEVAMPTCKLHPKYTAKKPPKSKKEGCTCLAVYEARELGMSKTVYDPVLGESENHYSGDVVGSIVRQLYKFPEELKDPKEERSFLSASRVGGCVRRLALDKLGAVPEPLSVRSRLTFMNGDYLEAMYRYLFRASKSEDFTFIETPELKKITIGGEEQRGYYDGIIEVPIDLLKEEVGGSDDFWADLKKKLGKDTVRIVMEMKTKADYGFKDLAKSQKMGWVYRKPPGSKRGTPYELVHDDGVGYRAQMGYYIRQAFADGDIDIPMGVWFVVNKNTAASLELYVSLKQLVDDIADAERNYGIVAGVVRENKQLPKAPHYDGGDRLPNFPCGYCEQKWNCVTDGVISHFEEKDPDSPETRWKPVYSEEPTIWLEVDFDKGKPVWLVMEKAPGDDE